MVKKWLNTKKSKPQPSKLSRSGLFGAEGGVRINFLLLYYIVLEYSIFNVLKMESNRIKRPYKKLGG